MDAVRKVVNSSALADIFDLPPAYRNRKIEVILRPVEDSPEGLQTGAEPGKARVFGCAKGQFRMADDFDAPLEDFKDYM